MLYRLAFGVTVLMGLQACSSGGSHQSKSEGKPSEIQHPTATLNPRYPAAAVKNGTEGYVCFVFTIKADGSVAEPRVYDSKPQGVFENEATRALSKWKFRPVIVDGVPVDTPNAKYCLDFKLSDD